MQPFPSLIFPEIPKFCQLHSFFMIISGEISNDIVLMADEMYLRKAAQYSGGTFVGADEEGNLYKGILNFMIVGLKQSVPLVIRSCPEISIHGDWVADEISKCLKDLLEIGFNVRVVVTDNHSTNVNAFKIVRRTYNASSDSLYIQYPGMKTKTYLFFDTVHLLKNIRNNLFNNKKFVFPFFNFSIGELIIASAAGYISWGQRMCNYYISKNLKIIYCLFVML